MAIIQLYDTTLRDGAQQEGIAFSVADKIRVTWKLDELGIDFIEGGWPGSNPKEDEYFAKARSLDLQTAQLVAFGSTRKAGTRVEDDLQLRALLKAGTHAITLVGKSSDIHVTDVLETSLDENLAMIRESVAYLKAQGKLVFFDAEHFFDGFQSNQAFALEVIRTAWDAGAHCVILCDTNGGTLPQQVRQIVGTVASETAASLGIHAHNDSEVAVANSLAALDAGVTQIQGTVNGYGERCGNANLLSIIANLKLKLGVPCVTDEQLSKLHEIHLYVSEIVNMPPANYQPYVGASAFSHKGGLHASAILKLASSYQHIDPAKVGNNPRIVVSELAGRGNLTYKLKQFGLDPFVTPDKVLELVHLIKDLESRGFQFEGADASLEMLIRHSLPDYQAPFELVDFLVVVEKRRRGSIQKQGNTELLSEASVKIRVGPTVRHTVAEGTGPVNALDQAMRKALLEFYPNLSSVKLIDYKVRVVDQGGTGSVVRVLIETGDGETRWQTVGASADIIEASWIALADSFEYWLARFGTTKSI